MITLRLMQPTEFSNYRDYFVIDYAQEIASNFGYSTEKSKIIAAKELADDLPQNVTTADNFLLCIEESDSGTIGYLWYKQIDDGTTAFILDFVLLEAFRGRGYGKATLTALEKQLVPTGIEQIKLRVAFDNDRAFGLYKKLGFSITGYNMVKILAE